MTLRDVLRILWRRILWAAVAAAAVIGVGLYQFSAQRPHYEITTTLLVPAFRQVPPVIEDLVPTFQKPSPNDYIVSAQGLDLPKIVDKYDPKGTVAVRPPAEPRQNTIHIVATASTEAQARGIAGEVEAALLALGPEMATKFIDDARAAIDDEIQRRRDLRESKQDEIDAAVRIVTAETDLSDPLGHFERLGETLSRRQEVLRTTEDRLDSLRARRETLGRERAQVEHLRLQFPSALGLHAPRVVDERLSAAEGRLEELYARREDNLFRWREGHPGMQELEEEIRSSRQRVLDLRWEVYTDSLDVESRRLDGEIAATEVEVAALAAKLDEYGRERAGLEEKLRPPRALTAERDTIDRRIEELDQGRSSLLPEVMPQGLLLRAAVKAENAPVVARTRFGGLQDIVLYGLLALALAVGAAYFGEFIDATIRSEQDVRRTLNYPVLAVIHDIPQEELRELKPEHETIVAEVFDTVATLLVSRYADRPVRLVLTSPSPGEGKTTLSLFLAAALARQGHATLVVDADTRNPRLHKRLSLPGQPGLTEFLASYEGGGEPPSLDSALSFVRPTPIEGLSFLPAGGTKGIPYGLFEPKRLQPAFALLGQRFEFTVIDTPPILRAADALKLSGIATGVIVAIESGETDKSRGAWAKHLLDSVQAPILGVLLNRAPEAEGAYYYYYYRRRYYTPTAKKPESR